MPARSGRPGRWRRGLTRAMAFIHEAVRGLKRRSARGLRGPSHVDRPLTLTIGRDDVAIVAVEPPTHDVLPPRTRSNHAATIAPPPSARRYVAVFGSVDAASRSVANGAFSRRAGGEPSACATAQAQASVSPGYDNSSADGRAPNPNLTIHDQYRNQKGS